MSVRKNDRDKGDLEVINASRLLIEYTYDRVRDQKIFPKKERWLMDKSIWDAVVGLRTCILRANDIRVETKEDAEERLLLEKEALGYLGTLETLIDLCHIKNVISDDRAEYWTKLVTDTLKPLKGWLKSDRIRYKPYLKG